jgi:hypothetical protein
MSILPSGRRRLSSAFCAFLNAADVNAVAPVTCVEPAARIWSIAWRNFASSWSAQSFTRLSAMIFRMSVR